MASLNDFRGYAPQLSSIPSAEVLALLARATRWSNRVITTQIVVAADRTDAECAYAIYLHQSFNAQFAAQSAGTRKLGDASVSRSSDDLLATRVAADDWESRAWIHLYDGGYPRGALGAGVTR